MFILILGANFPQIKLASSSNKSELLIDFLVFTKIGRARKTRNLFILLTKERERGQVERGDEARPIEVPLFAHCTSSSGGFALFDPKRCVSRRS